MDNLEKLKDEIFSRQNVLAEIYHNFGYLTLNEYAQQWRYGKLLSDDLNSCIFELAEEIHGSDLAFKVVNYLKHTPLVSTIDHHGLVGHPFFLNSNLIYSLNKKVEFLVCFSTAGVSLNNSSWPAGMVYHDEVGNQHRISFFPDRLKTSAVYSVPAISSSLLNDFYRKLKISRFSSAGQQRVWGLLEKSFAQTEIQQAQNFTQQSSRLSLSFWQSFFPQSPELIYLPIEDLVSRLLIKFVLFNPDHLLYRLFFTIFGQQLIEKYFKGSLGAFFSQHKGSFLFWAVDNKGRRLHLRREGQKLLGENLEIDLAPQVVKESLEQKLLYPTSLVCFMVMLYYEMTCLGGFNQVNWLTNIKIKFLDLLKELDENVIYKKISEVKTNNFAEASLSFLLRKGKIFEPSSWDLYLDESKNWYEAYYQLADKLTLKESLENSLPEIYNIIMPISERDKNLANLSQENIMKSNDSWGKIITSI